LDCGGTTPLFFHVLQAPDALYFPAALALQPVQEKR